MPVSLFPIRADNDNAAIFQADFIYKHTNKCTTLPVTCKNIHQSGFSCSWRPHDANQLPAVESSWQTLEQSFVTWQKQMSNKQFYVVLEELKYVIIMINIYLITCSLAHY